MNRPTLAEILRTIRHTTALQIAASDDGRRLLAADPEAVAGVVDRVAANLANIVEGWIDDAAGVES